jgi:NAD(P)H-hydrate repair Nnr-like enzyme with NAD(P)H-hydrate epimerase domain
VVGSLYHEPRRARSPVRWVDAFEALFATTPLDVVAVDVPIGLHERGGVVPYLANCREQRLVGLGLARPSLTGAEMTLTGPEVDVGTEATRRSTGERA